MRSGTHPALVDALLAVALGSALLGLARPAAAGERELEQETAPGTVKQIDTPLKMLFPVVYDLPSIFPWLPEHLQDLPPFFADTRLGARFRTYYLYKDRAIGELSEAWAIGGSLYYRSGWLANLLSFEVEGFTSQPIYAPDDRGGTDLLTDDQQGYSALGIVNATLRHAGLELVGYRQYLNLPYVNRNDNRMTPNTFEALRLEKPEGRYRFTGGYVWKIKRQTEDSFVSMTELLGLDRDRGLFFANLLADPTERLHLGTAVAGVPDVFVGVYAELGAVQAIRGDLEGRLDAQFVYESPISDALLGEELAETWNLGVRGSTSWKGAVLRLGGTFTASGGPVLNAYGSSPSYLNLMQRVFNRSNEKAILASVSYDFERLSIEGLSFIVNVGAGFGGESAGRRGDAQEVDVTLDYRPTSGPLRSLWLRVRGSWLNDDLADRTGTDIRVILRYDLPVL